MPFFRKSSRDPEPSTGCPTPDDSLTVGRRGPGDDANLTDMADPVDRALASLRQTAPPVGLEQRVLRNVEARRAMQKSAPHAARWRTALSPVSRPSSIASAAVAALLVIVACVSYHPHRNVPTIVQTKPPVLSPRQAPESLSAVASVRTLIQAPAPTPLPRAAARPVSVRSPAEGRPEPKPELQDNVDHPAPELPLTAQERLLLRIAWGDRPQQIAANRRLILPMRSAEDTVDFDKFFEPYTLPLTEGDPK